MRKCIPSIATSLNVQLKCTAFVLAVATATLLSLVPAVANLPEEQIEDLDQIKIETRQFPSKIDVPTPQDMVARFLRVGSEYGYEILDPTSDINRKQRIILKRKQEGVLVPDQLHLQCGVTAIANYQSSNRSGKFGHLMRHPTASNQIGDTVSEMTIHSAQMGFTSTLGKWVTAHAIMLFDPEQSFGRGTNTDLERNQIQMRQAYILLGDLGRSPFYLSLGKMAVTFGLTDTVNPFTASTVWHAFGGLANGLTIGYVGQGLNLSFMGIQGGSQFRAANTPVEGTAIPSKVNNFAVDAHYHFELGSTAVLLLGVSHQHGTAYCQDFPVVHFEPCRDNNPAFDVYGKFVRDNVMFKGEFAQTHDVWPGTFNPGMPEFSASKVTSFDVGGKYRYESRHGIMDFSAEFSRFIAGPHGAPWERQDQVVTAVAWFARPSAKLFAEYTRVRGYAPLNFISGGNIMDETGNMIPDQTHSDRSARSNVIMVGANICL